MMASVVALDVGEKRIGVAIADLDLRFANPLVTLLNDKQFWDHLSAIIEERQVVQLVVGLPRGLDGQETAQTAYCRNFISQLQTHCKLPIQPQDEAATSVKAEAELRRHGKPYAKAEIDALAAAYILDDYLLENRG